MTRGEEIRKAIDTIFPIPASVKGREYAQALIASGFEAGAQWADDNPKSPWISVKDKLPCDDKEMVMKYVAGLETRTKLVCVLLENDFIDMTYMYKLPLCGWRWNIRDTITHWFPIPEPPKQ